MKWLSVLVLLLSVVLMTGICGKMSFACDHNTQGTADGGDSSASADSKGSTGHSSAGTGQSGGVSKSPGTGHDGNHEITKTKDMPTLCDYWRLPWCPEKEGE